MQMGALLFRFQESLDSHSSRLIGSLEARLRNWLHTVTAQTAPYPNHLSI